jgi:N-carbamoylputrescine amidase
VKVQPGSGRKCSCKNNGKIVVTKILMKNEEPMKHIKLAGIQMKSTFGKTRNNLDHAARYVESAVRQGAQMIVMPELMPSGYALTDELWKYAEPIGGRIETWLCETAKKCNIYLGTSYLQADRTNFYNTFALASPVGKIAGRVRKQFPAFTEPYFFRGQVCEHFIDTEIGRVGVGICNDNHLTAFAKLLRASQVDLLLMPHARPLPVKTGKSINKADIDRQREIALGLAPLYARIFGIPAVMVNHCGPCALTTPPGLIIKLLPPADFYSFPGLSVIADSDGSVQAQAGSEEGFVIADVVLDPDRKCYKPIPDYLGRVYAGSAGRNLIRVDETLGWVSYTMSAKRLNTAQQIATDREPNNI